MSTMKFCQECNNVLYPKEDKEQKILLYACRDCDHQEVAGNNIVFKMEIRQSVTEHPHAAADPTLPRTKNVRCPNCDHREAAFYQKLEHRICWRCLFLMANFNCSISCIILSVGIKVMVIASLGPPLKESKAWHCSLSAATRVVITSGETDLVFWACDISFVC